MEHLFPGLEPPKRTEEAKKKSLQQIKQVTEKRRKFDWQFYATIVSAIVVLFILIASINEDSTFIPNQSNVASDASIDKVILYEHNEALSNKALFHLNKWYYIGEKSLNKDQIEQITPLIERAIFAEESIAIQYPPSFTTMLVTLSDGSEHIISIHYQEKVLYNWATEYSAPFTLDEYFDMIFDIKHGFDKNLSIIIKLLLLFGCYALYAAILRKISPIRIINDEQSDMSILKSLVYGIGFLLLLFTVLNNSENLFGGYNILYIVSVFAIVFILISVYHYVNRNTRSFWEIPISVAFFTLFTIIFTL